MGKNPNSKTLSSTSKDYMNINNFLKMAFYHIYIPLSFIYFVIDKFTKLFTSGVTSYETIIYMSSHILLSESKLNN